MSQRKICRNHHSPTTVLLLQEAVTEVPVFFDTACYQFYLRHLFHSLNFYQVNLHAYVVLPDLVCLLASARTRGAAAALLASVNRAYRDYCDTRFLRTCRQWPHAPCQVPVAADAAVLACQKLVECEPVCRGRVTTAAQWPWSSYRSNALGSKHRFLTRHPALCGFLRQASDPGSHYRAYINAGFARGQYAYLHARIARNLPLGVPSASLRTGAAINHKGTKAGVMTGKNAILTDTLASHSPSASLS